jgi:hypothetical protein
MSSRTNDPRANGASPVRSYTTRFETDEDPISEGGMWLNGRSDGVDWTDVYVEDGLARGCYARNSLSERRAEQGNLPPEEEAGANVAPVGDWDDPTAILSGEWGPNQYAEGVVFAQNPTEQYFQEVQIRLRFSLRANFCAGYEFIFRPLQSENAYLEIVRWNGVIGDWKSLAREVGVQYGVKDGDVVGASVVGNLLTAFINGAEVVSVADAAITDGAPGIGFNFGCANTNVDHGFRSFEAHTYA